MERDPHIRKLLSTAEGRKLWRSFMPVVGNIERAWNEEDPLKAALYGGLGILEVLPLVGVVKDGVKLARTAGKLGKLGNSVVGQVVEQLGKQLTKETVKTGESILAEASQAAFNAADDVGSIFIKSKHLNSSGGNFAKFATADLDIAKDWVQIALRSPNGYFLPNPQLQNTFQLVTNLGFPIGTKGQTSIRVIVGFDGKVINAFPVR